MSVIVEKLTKTYDTQNAVNNISFTAQKGSILGFLGPNGAGKTTTMKIITCFLPQTSGKVTVCGFNTLTHSLEVRKKIGYLPEHNPLYVDMYVREYLLFVTRIQKINNADKRIRDIIQLTGLTPESNKKIGALSKGYRQRVGLAQAMLHDPEVLILDEPTSGLDPNQLVEIRSLIASIGKEKTVIFSTHIMQEVQLLCDNVVIINKGNIVANDSMKTLQQRIAGKDKIVIEFDKPINATKLKGLPHVLQVTNTHGNKWDIVTDKETDLRKTLFDFAVAESVAILEIQRDSQNVEFIFRELTQPVKP